jgi:hypothetical protein
MVYFARIPCIIDGNDAKNTEKGDYKAKKQNLKNPDLSMKEYPDCTPCHME